jgi:hypothetical protein
MRHGKEDDASQALEDFSRFYLGSTVHDNRLIPPVQVPDELADIESASRVADQDHIVVIRDFTARHAFRKVSLQARGTSDHRAVGKLSK